jgi:hypothetical protein
VSCLETKSCNQKEMVQWAGRTLDFVWNEVINVSWGVLQFRHSNSRHVAYPFIDTQFWVSYNCSLKTGCEFKQLCLCRRMTASIWLPGKIATAASWRGLEEHI